MNIPSMASASTRTVADGLSDARSVRAAIPESATRGRASHMSWILRHRAFIGVLSALVAIISAETFLVCVQGRIASIAQQKVRRVTTELHELEAVIPPLEPNSTVQLDRDLFETLSELENLTNSIVDDGQAEAMRTPAAAVQATDVFFEIASFLERMHEYAARCAVEVKAQEQFGFSNYAQALPDLSEMNAVLRDRFSAELLLEALFEARPHSLLTFQRERPTVDLNQSRQLAPAMVSGSRTDYFEWDSRRSVRLAHSFKTSAMRVAFVGETDCLRVLLNALAQPGMPLFVREVAVEPLPKSTVSRDRTGEIGVDDPTPLISRKRSRFTITVEIVQRSNGSAGES